MKEKFKDNMNYLYASTKNTIDEGRAMVLNPTKKMKIAMAISMALFVVLMSLSFAFAAGDGSFWSSVSEALNKIYGGLVGVTTGLCIVCVVVGLIAALLTTNQQKTAQWIDFVKKAVIIWLIINFLGIIFKFFSDLAGNGAPDTLNEFKK